MVEIKINRNVLFALLTVVGLAVALGAGMWLGGRSGGGTAGPGGQAGLPAATLPPMDAPIVVTTAPGSGAMEVPFGVTGEAAPENTPAFGELTPEQDAAVVRLELADAVAKVGDPGVVFVDTRTDQEFAAGHIQGAVSMPAYTQDAMLETLPKDKEIILYCA